MTFSEKLNYTSSAQPPEASFAELFQATRDVVQCCNHSTYIGNAAGPPADDPPSPFDSGTDTDTESSDGTEPIDYSDIPVHLTEQQQAEYLFLGYQKHKRRFRRFMKKPIRRVRRAVRRAFQHKGKSRGKGKRRRLHGRGVLAYLTSLTYIEFEEVLFGGRGKGRGKGRRTTTGKGKGRRQNPRGPDGNIMTCDLCESPNHFRRD